ncbi:MAG TPA: methyltransferase domain-containing protein [Baekduia sp.]|nr:methyltransferase domain-containing protein [Baekduia sp.]
MSSSSPTITLTPETLKAGHRTMWASGDYPAVATHIDDAPPAQLLARLPDVAGRDVLDVATGTGNFALRLAAAGGRVTGLDLVEDLLDVARERAAASGLLVDWVTGDAEALPFADASFDVATSIFGIQFAPRHQVAADELVRVLRPGGTLGLVNWTPAGLVGQMFGVLGGYLPAPPAFASPPPRWGDEAHVRELLGDRVTDLAFTRGVNTFRFPTLDDFATFFEDCYGPTLTARTKLGPEAWEPCGAGLRQVYARLGTDGPGGFAIDSEFVVITARRR